RGREPLCQAPSGPFRQRFPTPFRTDSEPDVDWCPLLRATGLFAGLVAHDGGIEPVERQPGVCRLVSEGVDQGLPTVVVVDEDVPLVPLDQRQDVEFSSHPTALPACPQAHRRTVAGASYYRPARTSSF